MRDMRVHWVLLLVLVSIPTLIHGHGRLIEPPSRASAWRYGFDTPHNYNDHELYCGGFTRQWVTNEGKCGVCGDPWDSKIPRSHEYGGTFGQGVIVRRYNAGQTITIRVELTANHFGYFQFSVCPNYRNASQECLAKHILRMVRPQDGVDHQNSRYFPKDGNKVYEMKYRLPKMQCPHCLLQWRYIAGNNWGNCPNGTGAVGCGPQEEFRACADITIDDKSRPEPPPEDNEIPEEETPLKPQQTVTQPPTLQPPSYSPISSIIISLVSFLVIFLTLCLIYFHYYQIGSEVRRWITDNPISFTSKEKSKPPVAPPRGRRGSRSLDGMYEVNLKSDCPA